MRIDILTLFPEVFEPYINTSIVGRAQKEHHADIHLWNIRDYSLDERGTVDDTPYGGGAGMVMKIEPIHKALQVVSSKFTADSSKTRIIVLSARGTQFTQSKAQEYSKLDHLIFICGRYEGIDQRVADNLADEEISVGPYVLAGGELPAMVVAEAAIRLIPGVLGNPESLVHESHSLSTSIEAPQYTKPEEYNGWKVPDVLLSGNHSAIEKWRNQ
ncbi:MAG TPA: tRNA (guanosine(37)-N1)-methyltransferase TrmD [Candidatus Andersenbacteria bacterium]|nr:tRNA (guanosine(37)-N1)-methyltransferase TrmD [Candidatus Andersenbacteria bacterium]